ncbi:MAG TPA: peptidase S41 [Bacteroidetes bacterium]|nr:peptidase S41 [Bacteroidota bacterium]
MKTRILSVLMLGAFGLQAQVPNTLTSEEKVFGLSKFWQEVNYNFVYLEKIDRAAWDSTYKSLIGTIQKTENDYEYYRELQRFCALLKDGHTNIFFPGPVGRQLWNTMFGDYRIFLSNIENKAIITRVNASKKDEIPVGSEIIEVNGLATQTYLDRFVSPYISSSTDYVLRDLAVGQLLQGLPGDRYSVKLRTPQGSVKQLELVHARTTEEAVFPPFETRKLLDFRWIDGGIAYVALNSFDNRAIDSLFVQRLPELSRAAALIVDLRNNGGGSTGIGTAILQYLTNDRLLYGSRQVTRLHMPAYKAWGRFVEPKDTASDAHARKSYLHFKDQVYYTFDAEPDSNKAGALRVVVPTALLIGHNTASAAEDFLICADRMLHMVRIGENSFGSTGQPFMFSLPGGGNARICTKKDTFPDGREFVGVGVVPHIEVKKTLRDFRRNTDPVLARAVEYLRSKLR